MYRQITDFIDAFLRFQTGSKGCINHPVVVGYLHSHDDQINILVGGAVRGVGDFEAGTEYSFINVGGSSFHIAPRFSIQVPVGDVNKELSEDFIKYEPALILARDFPKLHRTQFFTEIGASLVQRVRTPADANKAEPSAHELNWGSGFFVLFPHAAATLEFNWDNNQWNHHGKDNEIYLTPGCLWRARRKMEIGLGIPVGLNRGSDRFDVMAHLVWEF